jgi:PAS domain S-box-containing protein
VNDTIAPPSGTGGKGPDWSAVMAEAGSEARAILRAVTRLSPLPLVLCDPRRTDCPVVFCNEAFLSLTGYTEDEVLGRNCRFLQGPQTDPAAIQKLRDAMAAPRRDQIDLWNYRKDGTKFWNSMFIGPILDPDGKLIYFFGSQTDATPRWEAEAARAAEQRLDSLRNMARAAATEVDSLMGIIVGAAERVTKNTKDPWVADQLGRMTKSARSAMRLASQMLAFAGHQDLHPKLVDVNKLVADFQPIAAQVAATRARVELVLHAQPLQAMLDPGQLNLALFSLVKNAVEAAQWNGGRIRLATRAIAAGEVEITVTDDGIGMPPDVAANARIPFFTTRDDPKAMGLGLSTVAGFCQQSNGRLVIESAPGKGTTIRLIFPRD